MAPEGTPRQRQASRGQPLRQLFGIFLLSCACAGHFRLGLAFGQAPAPGPRIAATRALVRFRAAIRVGSREALLPTLTSRDRAAIRERSKRGLPLFRVKSLAKLFAGASGKRGDDGSAPGPGAPAGVTVTLLGDDRARADVAPLLSFRPSIYLSRETVGWRVDLAATVLRLRWPRPKEEIVAICREALRGIADDADLVETEHFLIFARTGPTSARNAARLLDELYHDFQRIFPFDLRGSPSRESPASAAPGTEAENVVPAIRGPHPYMVVFLFSNKKTYEQFAARHDPGNRSSRGYATPAGYFATWRHRAFRSVVRHEGAHLLMYRRMLLFAAPNWLAEGIAETMTDPGGAVLAMRLRRMFRKGKPVSLRPLMTKRKIGPGADYLLAHSLVRFLRQDHAKEWVELLRFIRRPERPHPEECRLKLLSLLALTQAQLDEEWWKSVADEPPR